MNARRTRRTSSTPSCFQPYGSENRKIETNIDWNIQKPCRQISCVTGSYWLSMQGHTVLDISMKNTFRLRLLSSYKVQNPRASKWSKDKTNRSWLIEMWNLCLWYFNKYSEKKRGWTKFLGKNGGEPKRKWLVSRAGRGRESKEQDNNSRLIDWLIQTSSKAMRIKNRKTVSSGGNQERFFLHNYLDLGKNDFQSQRFSKLACSL